MAYKKNKGIGQDKFVFPNQVGDKTGWNGNKNPGVKPSSKNMQSAGFDTSEKEAHGHSQK